MQKGNINDIKSTFYRLKKMIKFNNTNINKFIYHFRRMIESYPVLKDYEIKNMIVKLSVQYRHLFKKNSKAYKIINCALNMISEKKIIIFNESEEDQLIKSNKTHTFNFLKKYNGKKFIFIESNSKSVLEYIKNYIFSNDIIVLFNGKINKDYMRNIINFHDKNKVIVF